MPIRGSLLRLASMLASKRLVPLLTISASLLLLTPRPGYSFNNELQPVHGLVRISQKNLTAFNNRNVTIECHADLKNRSDENASFTVNGRMVLTFMTVPRTMIPLDQIQSFLHCFDPSRTRCWAEFNLDLTCLEDKMNYTYYKNLPNYRVEAVCQVDDKEVCNRKWQSRYPLDCWDSGQINVILAPKLNQQCLHPYVNETQECGEHQYCDPVYGICLCNKDYTVYKRRCIPREGDVDELLLTEKPRPSTYAAVTEPAEPEDNSTVVVRADSKSTFKAIVIFLLVVAILLCIVLGIVIIWSRRTRRMLEELSR